MNNVSFGAIGSIKTSSRAKLMTPLPPFVIMHVPHDSCVIPANVRQQLVLTDEELARELIRMTDHHTKELFAEGVLPDQIVRAEVSRLVVDVERFEDDGLEPMSRRGMGVVYECTCDGDALRRPISNPDRQTLIDTWYRPHHERLATLTQQILDRYGRALLIDAHSFPSKPLPYELDQRSDRPQICIGTDDFHTPTPLATAFVDTFRDGRFDVRLNAPFSGAMVSHRHYQSDKRVSAVMLEVNRGLYIRTEESADPSDAFDEVARKIRRCICAAIRSWDTSA